MLELIDRGACSASHPEPLLFVHGGWHGAWCWADNFLDFFADNGFRAVAVSLRGHGGSTLSTSLNACSIADYVDDVATAATLLGTDPVLIGHSMGGFVVQQFLHSQDAPAAVLMASMPARAVQRAAVGMRITRRHPVVSMRAYTVGSAADLVNTPRLAREHFFSADTPEPVVEACAARLQAESGRAGGFLVRSTPKRVNTPLLVLGADNDHAVAQHEVRATARAYRTQAEFFPGMGHNMMLETGWRSVAERIQSWLAVQEL